MKPEPTPLPGPGLTRRDVAAIFRALGESARATSADIEPVFDANKDSSVGAAERLEENDANP